MRNKTIALVILSAAGFLDALYLTVEHYRNALPPCSFVSGCERVLTSAYSVLGPVPVAMLGVIFYLAILFGMILFLDTGRIMILRPVIGLSCIGFLASLWFLFVQLFLIKAICLYCLFSAGISSALFVIAMSILYYDLKERSAQ